MRAAAVICRVILQPVDAREAFQPRQERSAAEERVRLAVRRSELREIRVDDLYSRRAELVESAFAVVRRKFGDERAHEIFREKIVDDDMRKRPRATKAFFKSMRGSYSMRPDDIEVLDVLQQHETVFRARSPRARFQRRTFTQREQPGMSGFPYFGLPPYRSWRGAACLPPERAALAPAPFAIGAGARVATAGSCFASHLGSGLRSRGFTHYVTEGQGPFSALFGNIYTCVQLLQLFERAYGRFAPAEPVWRSADGFVDPFRPRVKTFLSEYELAEDRERHLAAVRSMFESMDVLLFTLGMNELWYCREDGAALPACPGNGCGEFSSDRYAVAELGVDENVTALQSVIDGVRSINARARFIFSVSPVLLAATAVNTNVAQATAYGKSVLRVAAERACRANEGVAYFPAFEIVTSPIAGGPYFTPSSRHVSDDGVRCVLDAFFEQFTGAPAPDEDHVLAPPECEDDELEAAIERDAARLGWR